MKLKQLGLINWANLENRNYQFADINLISGSSGAGKTTLLDALQTVLTAAAHNVVQYNPGQEEATQQSRTKETRSMASYILGCDDGKYARVHPTCGYILAVFRPEAGESSHCFTAIVGACARIDSVGNKRTAKLQDELYAILPELELGIDDLLVEQDERKEIVLLEDLVSHIRLKYRDHKLEPATTKEEYLRQLYGAFQGKKLAHKLEARNAAKQIVKFMAYKPEADLDSFVRNAILEQKDMSEAIDQVQNMMKTIHTMEREAAQIEQGIGLLVNAGRFTGNLIDLQLKQQSALYEQHNREAHQNRRAANQALQRLKTQQAEIIQLKSDIESMNQERRLLQDSLRQFEARRQGITPLQEQERLSQEKRHAETGISEAGYRLLRMNAERNRYRRQLDAIYQLMQKSDPWVPNDNYPWRDKLKEIRAVDGWDDIGLSTIVADISATIALKESANRVSSVYAEFTAEVSKAKDSIFTEFLQSGNDLENKSKRQVKLEKEISHMQEANRVVYREDTERALRLLREKLSAANPQVVCDHIEVVNPDWQAAIEAFMGENRFLIVVDPAYEIEALNLAGSNGLKSALVQGTKAVRDASSRTAVHDSIYGLMDFSHETVRAYFLCAYGDVAQVLDPEKLRSTRRGLMTDGRASSNYKLFVARINDDDLKLGKAARQRALEAKRGQLRQLSDQIQFAEMKKRSLDGWRRLLDNDPRIDLASPILSLIESQRILQHTEAQLAKLDLSEYQDLLKEIEFAKKNVDNVDLKLQQHHQNIGKTEANILTSEKNREKHETIANEQDERANTELEKLQKMSNYYPDFNLEERLQQIDTHVAAKDALFPLDEANGRRQMTPLKGITDQLTQFNSMNLQNITINFDRLMDSAKAEDYYDAVQGVATTADVLRQIKISHNILENNILAAHKQNLSEISQSFNKTFISHLCHTLHNYLEQGQQQLESLNRKLKHHIFGEEYYEFSFNWLPEFKEYWDFLKEATGINLEHDGGLFRDQALSADGQTVFDRIKTLLLSEDLEKSKKELKRITDYRNYRVYDIFKVLPNPVDSGKPHKISLKSYGTGSGGQMETPSYVIRAAALASALKLDVSRSNLKTLMIDESFGKMDEARSKAILKYLNQTLGFQILFVIPSKASGPFHDAVDQVIEITKVEALTPRGELHTRVHTATNVLHKERVAKLWEQEKIQIRNQASLFDFSVETDATGTGGYRALQ